jgi:hypothetical protein
MTKEDLLRDHDKYAWECDESEHVVPYSAAEKAMDEYAIAFGGWLYKNFTQCDITDGWVERAKPLSKNSKTTEQLHDQFIEQQNKP